jgi:hypothetical protein
MNKHTQQVDFSNPNADKISSGTTNKNTLLNNTTIKVMNKEQQELKFDKETADGLYRIFCGLSRSVYTNAEVYDEAKPNMEKAYNMILEWGRNNCDDMRGEKLK